MTLISGIGKPIVKGNVQAAIDAAGAAFRERFGRPPTHIALPPGCDPATVNTYTLQIGHPAGPRNVVVGEACDE